MRRLTAAPHIRNHVVMPTDPVELSYMAGFLDGEGCLTKNNKCWRLSVNNTHLPIIEWFWSLGGTRCQPHIDKRANHSVVYQWQVTSTYEVWQVLTALVPYMRVKKEKALAVLRDLEERYAIEGLAA